MEIKGMPILQLKAYQTEISGLNAGNFVNFNIFVLFENRSIISFKRAISLRIGVISLNLES
jgi:hypothetical protein